MQWLLLFPFMVMLLWGSESYPISHHSINFPLLTAAAARSSNNMNTDRDTSLPVILRVQYCGGWGYERFFLALKEATEKQFPNSIVQLEGIKDIGTTGNFEITLMNTRTLVHSKKTQGLGKCESTEERTRLFKVIRSYLEKKSDQGKSQ